MVSNTDVKTRYRSYAEDYPENTGLSFKSENETDYPIQDRALGGDTFESVFCNRFANESEYLFELDNRVPSIHELPIELLPTVATELNRALFVQVSHDHMAFWNYTYDLISHDDMADFGIPEQIVDLYSSILEFIPPDISMSQREAGLNDVVIGCYLGYPLLEATAKWFASDYIDLNGEIRPGCEIKQLGRGGDTYGPPEDPEEADRCSDIGSILFHIEEEVAGPELRNNLEVTRRHIGDLYRTSDLVYGNVIKEHRNTLLHGENEAPAEIGIILNMTALLIWSHFLENEGAER